MFTGSHIVIYSKDAEADRAFFQDVLAFPSVDAGHGWLLFALPPAEVAFHPSDERTRQELYLMCADVHATISGLKRKGVTCGPLTDANWGITTHITLPGGSQVGLYQPRHPVAAGMPVP